MKEHCRRVLKQYYAFLEGDSLTSDQRTTMEQHLVDCAPCLEEAGLKVEIVEVTRVVTRLRGSCHCPDGLKQRISQLIEEA